MTGRGPPSEIELLDIIGDIYDCVLDMGRWPRALERLARVVDGAEAAITFHDMSRPNFAIQVDWNINREFAAVMQQHFSQNPFAQAAWYVALDEPISAFGYYGEAQLKKGKWFKETLGRFGYGDVALCLLARSASKFGGFSVHRKDDQPNYGARELHLLRLLAPHVRRAVTISELLDARALERDMLSTTLDMLAVGIVLTDAGGRIIQANHAAQQHLDEAVALRRDGDRLSARDAKSAIELRQAIAEAAGGSTVSAPRNGISMPVGELAVWVLPLDGGLRGEFAAPFSAKAVVFIREIGETQPLPAELFVRRYGITPAECRVLVLLAQGLTIAEAAEMLGIALATAKTHLNRLFQKTGAKRQAELIHLAASALAPAAASARAGAQP